MWHARHDISTEGRAGAEHGVAEATARSTVCLHYQTLKLAVFLEPEIAASHPQFASHKLHWEFGKLGRLSPPCDRRKTTAAAAAAAATAAATAPRLPISAFSSLRIHLLLLRRRRRGRTAMWAERQIFGELVLCLLCPARPGGRFPCVSRTDFPVSQRRESIGGRTSGRHSSTRRPSTKPRL